ncbi:MAG: anthranilate synthase component I [Pseudomonadota bacterium]
MNVNDFKELAKQGYNRIPVYRQLLIDDETPVSSYHKLAQGAYSFLFESVHGGERWGRYSIIGLPCSSRIEIKGHDITRIENHQIVEQLTRTDPLSIIDEYQAQFNVPEIDALPDFFGGLVGYFGYDCVRYSEPRLKEALNDPNGLNDVVLMLAEDVLIFDNLAGVLHCVTLTDPSKEHAYEHAQTRLDDIMTSLHTSTQRLDAINLSANNAPAQDSEQQFESSFGEDAFKQAVDTVKNYILAGDCMQVVLSQRLSLAFEHDPYTLYRVLRHLNPSPYMYYVNLGDTQIVGASPEVLVRIDDTDRVTVRPLAGTRRRGQTQADDELLEQELLSDPKERAEHLMLIDLGRNDIGRIAQTGSVHVTERYVVERYAHVMHISSNVEGRLASNYSALDALRSILPAGTLSGAPKVRAMEIIDELEPVKRGVYGGAIGYLAWNGEMDTAIAIRTAVIHKGTLHLQAGAGIVADSDPQKEWDETMNKARGMFKAIDLLNQHSELN